MDIKQFRWTDMSKYYIDSLYMTILNQLQNYNWSGSYTYYIENIKKYIKINISYYTRSLQLDN